MEEKTRDELYKRGLEYFYKEDKIFYPKLNIEQGTKVAQFLFSKFKCSHCGICCEGNLNRKFFRQDMDKICKFLNISHKQFKKNNTVMFNKHGGKWLGKCPYHENNKCSIWDARPLVCRQFPFNHIVQENNEIKFIPQSFCKPYIILLYIIFCQDITQEQRVNYLKDFDL